MIRAALRAAYGAATLGLAALFAPTARALPQYQRLFLAKYKFRPNCTLCHVSSDWELNKYGIQFFEHGRSLKAFEEIEMLDADQDGVLSGVEIQARANPGDPASTPKHPGDWLTNIPAVQPPTKHLLALFPGADRFELREGELSDVARRRVEARLGSALRDEDRYPVYFEAFEGKRPLGAALYASTSGKGACFFLVGYSRPSAKAKVRAIGLRPLLCSLSALTSPDFLNQFDGKTSGQMKRIRAPDPLYAAPAAEIVTMTRTGAEVLTESAQ